MSYKALGGPGKPVGAEHLFSPAHTGATHMDCGPDPCIRETGDRGSMDKGSPYCFSTRVAHKAIYTVK